LVQAALSTPSAQGDGAAPLASRAPARSGGLDLLARLVALLPWRHLRLLGAALGFVAGSVLRIRRRHVEASLQKAGISGSREHARAMYASLGAAVFEFLWLVARGAPRAGTILLTPEARAAFARFGRARAPGKPGGVVVATAHTGNWDFVGCALAAEYVDLTVVTQRLSAAWLDAFWQKRRAAFGIDLVDGAGVFARAAHALARGRAVTMLVDQAPERHSAVLELPFLGQTARCDTTPALLAARTGTPLVLALGRRLPDGRHSVDVPMVLEPPARASRAWIEDATRRIQAELERFVREHPAQWLWMHRRWKTAAEVRPVSSPGRPRGGLDRSLPRS
jgi:KDO2-lipid IV(A) lauroyltransferase